MTTPSADPHPVDALAAVLTAAWVWCDEHPGTNLPEILRSALEQTARNIGGVEMLVSHRPGSWEADLVRPLAAMADWG